MKRCLLATQSDERLACLVQAGHDPAFEVLVRRHRRPLLRYCRRLCRCDARAEEALQQTLLNAWIALRGETEVREPRAWLYGIARNAAINSMRREAQDGELADERAQVAFAPAWSGPSIDDAVAVHEALADVAALPRMQREVIVRAALAGHSHQEVASELGISDDAVRGLLYRARSALRAGFTALTPAPVLAWASSGLERGMSGGGAQAAELAAGGGTAGLAGLAIKAGAVALTTGIALSGIVAGHAHTLASKHLRQGERATIGRPAPHRSQAQLVAQVNVASASAAAPSPTRQMPRHAIQEKGRGRRQLGAAIESASARGDVVSRPHASLTDTQRSSAPPAEGADLSREEEPPGADRWQSGEGDRGRAEHGVARMQPWSEAETTGSAAEPAALRERAGAEESQGEDASTEGGGEREGDGGSQTPSWRESREQRERGSQEAQDSSQDGESSQRSDALVHGLAALQP